MIPVTRPYLPSRERLNKYLNIIYENRWLTNNGPLVQQFAERLRSFLGVEHLLLVSNGTLALQIAYRALGIRGKAVTTPFTFVATASSLQWEQISPVFCDIDPGSFCLDPLTIERALTPDVTAIVPVHVFGNACDVEAISDIAASRGMKVVYDAAHAFGVQYDGRSLLGYGDASTLSFHATKLFHSVEGGAVVFRDEEVFERAKLLINFGIDSPDSIAGLGINAKMNEFQAAMGLSVLDEIEEILNARAVIWSHYETELAHALQFQLRNPKATNNYAYVPVVFPDESQALRAKAVLESHGIGTRRYFYPSLDTLNFFKANLPQPISRDIAGRILCLPIYVGLDPAAVTSTPGWLPGPQLA